MANDGKDQGHGGGQDDHGGDGGNDGHGNQVTIVVNGREKTWTKDEISYEQLVTIAGIPLPDGPDASFTITYRNGHGNKPEGTLRPGQKVRVKKGMIFNVTATNRS